MVRGIFIQNYALIDSLDISFEEGLNIITGETGAGKSVLLGALSLLLGQRADLQVLRDKTKKCIIEATFDVSAKKLKKLFEDNDIDFQNELIIRREISPNGSSRSFVNDTPATLALLKELGVSLIDIHSQHDSLFLNNQAYQLRLLDTFAGIEKEVGEYQSVYNEHHTKSQQLHDLEGSEKSQSKELDYIGFQFKELDEASLNDPEEQEKLEKELELLTKSEEIKAALNKVTHLLGNAESDIISQLSELKNTLSPYSSADNRIEDLRKRIESTYIEVKDIFSEAESLEESVVFDPEKIEKSQDRLGLFYRLQKKHQVSTIAELIVIREDLDARMLNFSGLEEKITKLKNEIALLEKDLVTRAEKIRAKRKKSTPQIEKELVTLLVELGMPNATFMVQFEELGAPTSAGMDKITFLFSANKGSSPQPLNKVASGGELSRLMLGLKSIFAKSKSLPSIIFDEIDTGVSGSVADKMGRIMKEMALSMQVLTITHLPQLASKGSAHFFVYKEDDDKHTYTRIKKLSVEERVVEVAKMLSSGDPSVKAMENARELLTEN